MPGTRLNIDFFFEGMTPKQVNNTFPGILPAIKTMKAKASIINKGKDNEEMTVRAVYHYCRNDVNEPCDPEVVI